MPTLEEALLELGYDYPTDAIKKIVARDLAAAVATLHGAVGEDVDTLMPDDPRAYSLVIDYLHDLHDNKGVSAKVAGATRRTVADREMQLRLELRTRREEAGA